MIYIPRSRTVDVGARSAACIASVLPPVLTGARLPLSACGIDAGAIVEAVGRAALAARLAEGAGLGLIARRQLPAQARSEATRVSEGGGFKLWGESEPIRDPTLYCRRRTSRTATRAGTRRSALLPGTSRTMSLQCTDRRVPSKLHMEEVAKALGFAAP